MGPRQDKGPLHQVTHSDANPTGRSRSWRKLFRAFPQGPSISGPGTSLLPLRFNPGPGCPHAVGTANNKTLFETNKLSRNSRFNYQQENKEEKNLICEEGRLCMNYTR